MPVLARRRVLAVLGAVIVLVMMAIAVLVLAARSRPPIQASQVGLSGDVWAMPADQVRPFLHRHDVDALPPAADGPAVVARVRWSPDLDLPNDTFTVVLGDELGRSGVIQYVYGPSDDDVDLGNGSMWDQALAGHDWLAGDGTQQISTGDYMSFGQFASVPTVWTGDVWVVGYVTTPPATADALSPEPVDNPEPVLGVALNSGTHVWWIDEIARA